MQVFEKFKKLVNKTLRRWKRWVGDRLKEEIKYNIRHGYEKLGWKKIGEKRVRQLRGEGKHFGLASSRDEESERLETGQRSLVGAVKSDVIEERVEVKVKSPYARIIEEGKGITVFERSRGAVRYFKIPARPFFEPAVKTAVQMAEDELIRSLEEALSGDIKIKVKL